MHKLEVKHISFSEN